MISTIAAADADRPATGQWPKEQRAALVVGALRRRHFQAQYADNRAAALDAILALLPDGASVFQSQSTTLDQLGLLQRLRREGRHQLTCVTETDAEGRRVHGDLDQDLPLRMQLEREAFFADVFITSTAAVTLDGHIVDGGAFGNNVAPMIFGPAKVIIVVGMNKIVKDKAAAFERVARTHDTGGDPRLTYNCTGMLESALPRFTERINVIVVGEELGRP